MIAGDVYRPAAIDQLKVLGQQLDVPVFEMGTDVSPVEIVRQGMELAREKKNDYVLIDTAGRLHIDEVLMTELKEIKEIAEPNEILLVVDAMTGHHRGRDYQIRRGYPRRGSFVHSPSDGSAD